MRRSLSLIAVTTLIGASFTAAGAQAASAHVGGDQAAATASHRSYQRPSGSYTPPRIRWHSCPTATLRQAGARCGMLTVPLDYARPRGAKIHLAVSRVRHKTRNAKAQGVMLVNPGGPGGSGLELARLGAAVPHRAGNPYDWIGFDPRGVGRSRPSLTCDGDYLAPGRPSYDPADGTKHYWLTKTARYSHDCKTAKGARLLRHDHTTDTVADMESLRKALHAKKINYYGFSYGTYLGQVYATLHPNRVRRFVLDGVIDSRHIWYQANLAQDRQFDPNANTFFDWVAKHDATYGLGTSGRAVRQLYYNVLNQLADNPEPNFGAADWNDVFVGAAYYVYDWDSYAHILIAASKGDLAPAKAWYDDPTGPGADNSYVGYLAVECTDAHWPAWKKQVRDTRRIAAHKPFLAWNNLWFNGPCRDWPAPSGRPVHVTGRHVPPILLIEETNDAATPWSGAIETRRLFPRSRLIEGVGGTTHAGSLSGVKCTDNRIAAYLLHGRLFPRKHGLNRSDLKCPPVPPPPPTPATAAAPRVAAGSNNGDPLGRLRDLIESAAGGGR